jgi:hypothetical protein
MVEVEMGEKDVGDVLQLVPGLPDRLRQPGCIHLHAVVGLELRVMLVTDSGVDEEEVPAAGDQQAVRGHADAVALVRRTGLLPERPRDHAEHRPAVQPEAAVAHQRQLEVAQFHHGTESI